MSASSGTCGHQGGPSGTRCTKAPVPWVPGHVTSVPTGWVGVGGGGHHSLPPQVLLHPLPACQALGQAGNEATEAPSSGAGALRSWVQPGCPLTAALPTGAAAAPDPLLPPTPAAWPKRKPGPAARRPALGRQPLVVLTGADLAPPGGTSRALGRSRRSSRRCHRRYSAPPPGRCSHFPPHPPPHPPTHLRAGTQLMLPGRRGGRWAGWRWLESRGGWT